MQTRILLLSFFLFWGAKTFAQKEIVPDYKFSVSTPWMTFDQFGPERVATHLLFEPNIYFGVKF